MKKASKRRILFAARMATMVGAACFAVSGISETLGQEKEKSRPVYIATEEVTETVQEAENRDNVHKAWQDILGRVNAVPGLSAKGQAGTERSRVRRQRESVRKE